jgi:hypothetical protein
VSSRYYQSRAIILKNMDYRESDKIIHLFTEKEGKLSALARGVKKPKSSLRACVQPFCHSFFHFHRGREMELITQGRLMEFYANTREDISRLLYAVYIMELLDKSLLDDASLFAPIILQTQYYLLKIHKLPPHEYKYPSLYRDGLTRGSTLVGFYTHLNNPRLY